MRPVYYRRILYKKYVKKFKNHLFSTKEMELFINTIVIYVKEENSYRKNTHIFREIRARNKSERRFIFGEQYVGSSLAIIRSFRQIDKTEKKKTNVC